MTAVKRKDYIAEIVIPSEIQATLNGNVLTMKKGANEVKRIVDELVKIKLQDGKVVLEVKKAGKEQKRKFGTAKSHIKNIVEGLMNGYEYNLEICHVHFPMTVTFDKSKYEFIVKNMLGEKYPRVVGCSKNVQVDIKAPQITLKSFDLEAVGQAAANLEKITKIRNRDRNKFQDGIFITKKPGKIYL